MAKMNMEEMGEIGADLCQTATVVRVFLRCGGRFLTEPEASSIQEGEQREAEREKTWRMQPSTVRPCEP
jgi:hypothetical protein